MVHLSCSYPDMSESHGWWISNKFEKDTIYTPPPPPRQPHLNP